MGKIAIVFPGIGYNCDRPLLHYAKKIAAACGYEILEVNYSGFSNKVKGDPKRMQECFETAYNKAGEVLKDIDFAAADDVLVIAKSIGCSVACSYMQDHGIKARFVLYTPLEQTFSYEFSEAIVFTGTLDQWADTQVIRRKCDEKGLPVYITSFANHSLEIEDESLLGVRGGTTADANIKNLARIMHKTREFTAREGNPNLLQNLNPYMASWEYVPDGEPYVFGDRVYVYGSHDKFGGNVYCELDYVCWSAPVKDLGAWRYEGIIYRTGQDPDNKKETGKLYAPDVAKGSDGRYYLYYAINTCNHISVAVCDFPAGEYEFYGFVHYKDGTRLGDKKTDEQQFDPGVLYEDGKTYLYTGFCAPGDINKHGAMVTVLDSDMLTILEAPRFVAPSDSYSSGTGFEGHEFFEAPSIRKMDDKYVFIYSSIKYHELCYAAAESPTGPFSYKGVIISNGDLGIDTYKAADKCAYYCANNHGSIEKIGDDWYVFYHRHTNGTNYSRQGCFEKLEVKHGEILQAQMTSCNSIKPLRAEGVYPAYIACNLFNDEDVTYIPWSGWMEDKYPKITQDGSDGDMLNGYVTSMQNGATIGFKTFMFEADKRIGLNILGYGEGSMEIRFELNGPVIASIPISGENVWTYRQAEEVLPKGLHDLYITFRGSGWSSVRDITFS